MVDLTEVFKEIASIGLPLLGAVLPVPGGAAVGAALAAAIGSPSSTPAALLATLKSSTEAVTAAKQFELQHQEVMLKLTAEAEVRTIEAVNKTIQVEAASDHWPTFSWRPFIGFMFGLYISAQWILPLFKLPQPTVDPQLILAVGGILGIASWFRGKAQADPSIPTDNRG